MIDAVPGGSCDQRRLPLQPDVLRRLLVQGEDMTTPQLSRPPAHVHAAPQGSPRRLIRRTGRRIARLAVLLTALLAALLAVSAGANAVLTVRDGLTQPYGQRVTLPG